MMYSEDEFLPLSALQHLLFCERQCALIHIEQAWIEPRPRVPEDRLKGTGHRGMIMEAT